MAQLSFPAGVSTVTIKTPNKNKVVPSLSAMAFTASGATATDYLHNSILTELTTGVSYQVAVGLVGNDGTSGGWSVSPTTVSSGPLTITNVQNIINVSVSNASWPTNFQNAGWVAVFLKVGAGDFGLVKGIPLDVSNDMCISINTVPLQGATLYPIATLNSSTTESTGGLGNRTPQGYDDTTFTPTTDDIGQTDTVGGSVSFSPNNSGDFTLASSRNFKLSFKALRADVKTLIQAGAGDYTVTTSGGKTFQQSSRAINTAQVFAKGNQPLILTLPIDSSTGASTVMLCTSMLLQNQGELALAYSKKNAISIPFVYDTVPNDALTNNVCCVFTSARY